jgi:hypothetical protein
VFYQNFNQGNDIMTSTYITVVIQLPDDEGKRSAIAHSLAIGEDFNGGRIVAASLEDEMTLAELLSEQVGGHATDEARAQVRELHAKAEAVPL